MIKLEKSLIILLGVFIQMSMYNYVNAYETTVHDKDVNIKIIFATPKN